MQKTPRSRIPSLALAIAGLVFCALTYDVAHLHDQSFDEDCVQCLHLSKLDDSPTTASPVAFPASALSAETLPGAAPAISFRASALARAPPAA
tara:strand:- start:1025 stop:1303 length:279 start_codon:yes stop_codon:yes gene_type:complete